MSSFGSKPSPYDPKTRILDKDTLRYTHSGIGGPLKRRENMSGIGNNLRSHQPAAFGRSVARGEGGALSSDDQQQQSPSITELQRRPPEHLARRNTIPAFFSHRQRRGSEYTSATTTADAAQTAAIGTVLATNSPPQNQQYVLDRESHHPIAGSTAVPVRRHSIAENIGNVSRSIGSPRHGRMLEIVGSPENAFAIYSSVHKEAEIGGGYCGKRTMRERVGLGGSPGKDWMADRPSNIGAPSPQDSYPGSSISRLLRSLSTKKSNHD